VDRVATATSLEAVRRLLIDTYGPMRIDAPAEPHGLRLSRLWMGPIRLDRISFTMDGHAEADPLGVLVFGHVTSGSVSYASEGNERPQGPGDVFLTAQPEHPYTASIQHLHVELAIIDPSLVDQVAATSLGHSPEPVRFTGYRAVSPQAARSWRRTYKYVREQARAAPGLAGHPLVAGNAARLLAAAALTTFPNNTMTDRARRDRDDTAAATVRRAVAFIDEHAGQDITAADIAAAVHTSVRTLQLAFRRHLDTTPMNYLRRVRLARARHQLRAASPAQTTVTAVAARWGFSSPSRFTAAYRATYGVRPTDTLHG
jgi:AraC-like DNA-binding protein